METGLSTAVLNGANVEKCGMAPSSAPAFKHDTEGAPEFEQYNQAGTPLANNEAVLRTAPPETRDPALTPLSSRRRARHRSR